MASIHPWRGTGARAMVRPASRRRWVLLLAVLLLAASLRFLPTQSLLALDRMPSAGPAIATPANPPEQSRETFPGSAYFFAQDAFAPVAAPASDANGNPAVTTLQPDNHNPHILQIEAGPAALSMPLRAASIMDQARALQCLTNAIYFEAGNEPEEGQRAVAQVILNRVASLRWPSSVCGVVYQGGERGDQGCQFTFSCDGSMARTPTADGWARARRVAMRALAGDVFAPAGLATFYHTLAVHPSWSEMMRPVAVIGAHIFYRLPGAGGLPASFAMRYAGREYARPGPYAFSRPLRPLPLPEPIPDWVSSIMPPKNPAGNAPVALPSYQPAAVRSPIQVRTPSEAALPESTIRPEYRNTGRPLF